MLSLVQVIGGIGNGAGLAIGALLIGDISGSDAWAGTATVALTLGDILGGRQATRRRRTVGLLVVCLYLGLVVANFVWLWPILTAVPISLEQWNSQLWLPSWR